MEQGEKIESGLAEVIMSLMGIRLMIFLFQLSLFEYQESDRYIGNRGQQFPTFLFSVLLFDSAEAVEDDPILIR